MIKVNISKDHIEITGHAMFGDYGKDIVCASFSSIVITSLNAILCLDSKSIKYDVHSGSLNVYILKHDDVTDKLISNMIMMIKELKEKYDKNIQVNEEV